MIKICGIYKISNLVNNKVYIGQSVNIYSRWQSHINELKRGCHNNQHLQNAWNKYGYSMFQFEILEECNPDDLNEREQYYIDVYKSYNFENGYNLTLGGDGTLNIREVLQFDSFGNLIHEYRNGIDASDQTGLNCSAIYQCCNKRLKRVGKYFFMFKSDYDNDNDLSYWIDSNRNTPVEQYDLFGNLIKTWSSCAEIIKELGFNPTSCVLHFKGHKSDHGYIWKRINDKSFEVTPEYCKEIRDGINSLRSKKVYQYSLDGKLLMVYDSIHEASRYGFHKTMVKECCNGLRNKYKGYKWSFEEMEVA